jgi:hypothetical protein
VGIVIQLVMTGNWQLMLVSVMSIVGYIYFVTIKDFTMKYIELVQMGITLKE